MTEGNVAEQGANVDEQRLYIGQCLSRIQEAERALADARGALASLCEATPQVRISTYDLGDVTTKASEQTLAPLPVAGKAKAEDSGPYYNFFGSTYASSQGGAKDPSGSKDKMRFVDQIVFHEVTDFSATRLESSGGRSIAVQAEPKGEEAEHIQTEPSLVNHKVVWSGRHIIVVKICQDRLVLPVLNPTSNIRLAWDIIGLTFIIYETYAIPFYICFNAKPTGLFWLLTSVLNTYFIVDVAASFMTGYIDDKGHKKMAPPDIASRYIRRGFASDVIAGIPWEWLPDNTISNGNSNIVQATKMLRLIRISRLLRLLTMSNIMTDRLKMMIESHPGLVFCQGVGYILFLLFSITHWAACLWYQIGTMPNDGKTWVDLHVPDDASITECYVRSLYFTLTTMTTVGYGDITPGTYVEICFVLVLLLIATVVFATLMGSLTDLIANLNQEKNQQREKVLMLSRYMHWRGVSHEIFMAVRKYLLFLWETNHGYDEYEESLKKDLPPALRKELCYTIDGPLLRMAPFLAWMRDYEVCVKELANRVNTRILSRADTLFRVGQPNEFTIFMLRSGSVKVSLNESLFNLQPHDESEKADEEEASLVAGGGKAGLADQVRGIMKKQKSKRGSSNQSADRFAGVVLEVSAHKLQQRDVRERIAAKMIQRRWRGKAHARNASWQTTSGIRTKSVRAPNYFGESCLWTPMEQWEKEDADAMPYTYTVKCEERCEVVLISRRVLLEIIQRFHPWLGERFEFFQHGVIKGMKALAGEITEDTPVGSPTSALSPKSPPSKAPAPRNSQDAADGGQSLLTSSRTRLKDDIAAAGMTASAATAASEDGGRVLTESEMPQGPMPDPLRPAVSEVSPHYGSTRGGVTVAAASPNALIDLGSRWSEIAERSKAAADRMLLQAKDRSLSTPMSSMHAYLDLPMYRRPQTPLAMPPLRQPQRAAHHREPFPQDAGRSHDDPHRRGPPFTSASSRAFGKFQSGAGSSLMEPLL